MRNQVDLNCPFWNEIEQYLASNGKEKCINLNGKPMPSAYWNLICSKRDVALYCKGILIHRHWKITPVKQYFGFSGRDKNILLEYLSDLVDFFESKEGAKENMSKKWAIEFVDQSENLPD
jgi:hypothetical protein